MGLLEMTIFLLIILITVALYIDHIDAMRGDLYDDQFFDHVEKLKGTHLSEKQKEFVEFAKKSFGESHGWGLILELLKVFLKGKNKGNSGQLTDLEKSVYFWTMSQISRTRFAGLVLRFMVSVYLCRMFFSNEKYAVSAFDSCETRKVEMDFISTPTFLSQKKAA